MKRAWLGLAIILVLALSANVWGAEKTFQEVIRENQEMRKNITWMTEGLYQLGKSRDKHLAITKEQARRILPLYQELINKKIILTELKSEDPRNNAPKNLHGPSRQYSNLSPEEQQKRIKDMVVLTEFGKQQSRLIDSILSKEQIQFIDNLDFKPEKYGYFLRPNVSSGNGSQDQFNGGRFGNDPDNDQMRKKRQEAQKLLVKLNLDVLNILKKG